MKVLIDNCISYRIARALHGLVEPDGHEVVALRDRFSAEERDETWLPTLRAEGDWVVITADLGRKDGDRQVWLNSGLTVFFLKSAWLGGSFKLVDQSQRLLKYWPKFVAAGMRSPPGSCFDVGIQGEIKKARIQ